MRAGTLIAGRFEDFFDFSWGLDEFFAGAATAVAAAFAFGSGFDFATGDFDDGLEEGLALAEEAGFLDIAVAAVLLLACANRFFVEDFAMGLATFFFVGFRDAIRTLAVSVSYPEN